MTAEQLLEQAASVVRDRRRAYGQPRDLFERMAVRWSQVLGVEVTPAQVALCLIDMKIARLAAQPTAPGQHHRHRGLRGCSGGAAGRCVSCAAISAAINADRSRPRSGPAGGSTASCTYLRRTVHDRAALGPGGCGNASRRRSTCSRCCKRGSTEFYDLWPKLVGEPCRHARPAAAAPEAIDRMDEVIGLAAVAGARGAPPGLRRAQGVPWKRVAHWLGIGRTTAWQRWTEPCSRSWSV